MSGKKITLSRMRKVEKEVKNEEIRREECKFSEKEKKKREMTAEGRKRKDGESVKEPTV